MKQTVFAIIFFAFSLHSFGQGVAFPFEKANEHSILISELEQTYQSAIHTDTTLAVFKSKDQENTLVGAYQKLVKDLHKFLKKNNFYWTKPTRCFQRIYFDKNGKIDYFIYDFKQEVPQDEKQEFDRLLNEFIQKYEFGAKAPVKFSQCSPIVY